MSTIKPVSLRHKLEDLDIQTSPPVTAYGGHWSFRYEKSCDRLFLLYNRHTDSGTWAIHIKSASVQFTWPDDTQIYDVGLNDCLLYRNKTDVICTSEDPSFLEQIEGASVEMVIDIHEIYENTLQSFTILMDYDQRGYGSFESKNYGVSWTCSIINHGYSVEAKLTCNETTKSTLWSILAHAEFIVDYDDPEKMRTKEVVNTYSRCSENVRMIGRLTYRNTDDKPLKMKLVVVVLRMSGLRKRKLQDFEKKDEEMTDVCLVVKGKQFYVNKTILAYHSPVFRAMFFGNFSETSSNEVVIEDVDASVFETFISIIYLKDFTINATNVSELLQLADRYDVDKVIKKAEEVLMNDAYIMSVLKKLKIAEQYNLGALHHKVVDSLNEGSLKEVRKHMEELSVSTVTALFDRALRLWQESRIKTRNKY